MILVGLVASCTQHVEKPLEPETRVEAPPVISEADRQAAKRELDAAISGRTSNDVLDDLLRIEALAPGFAGLFIDKDGSLIAMLVNPENEGRARFAIDQLRARTEPHVFNTLSSIKIVRTRRAVFSLSQLMAWQNPLWQQVARLDGVNSIGVRIESNTLGVGVVDSTAIPGVWDAVRKLGIPGRAVTIDVHGTIRLLGGSRAAAGIGKPAGR